MNETNRLVARAAVAAVAIAAVAAAAQAQPTTAPSSSELLTQVRQLDRAAADLAVGTPDPQAVAAQEAKKAALIKQLIATPRPTPETIAYLGSRWRGISPTHAPQLAAEVDDAIRDAGSDDVLAEAYIAKINLTTINSQTKEQAYTAVKPIADAYAARLPDDKYLSGLYSELAGLAPDRQAEVDYLKKAVATGKSPQELAPAEARLKVLALVGKPLDLRFTDAIGGKPVDLAALKGKVVVLDFWATWCGPCVAEMPAMKKLYAEFKDRGVEFIGVSLDAPPEEGGLTKLREFCAKNEVPWPQYYQGKGWDADFSSGLGVMGVPTAFVLNKDGTVYTTEGRGQLDTLLPKLLGDQPATQPSAR